MSPTQSARQRRFFTPLASTLREKLLPYYQRLSRREQLLLRLAALTFPTLLFIFGVWLPTTDRIHALQTAMPSLQAQLDEARLLAERLQRSRHQGGVKKDALSLVEQAAKVSGIRRHITRIKPRAGMGDRHGLLIRLHRAPYPNLIRFLSRLAKGGLTLKRAKLMGSGKPGLLEVDLLTGADRR